MSRAADDGRCENEVRDTNRGAGGLVSFARQQCECAGTFGKQRPVIGVVDTGAGEVHSKSSLACVVDYRIGGEKAEQHALRQAGRLIACTSDEFESDRRAGPNAAAVRAVHSRAG